MVLGVRDVHGVDHHLDVGRILARIAPFWDIDQFDAGLVKRALEVAIVIPIGIGLLHDDPALLDQSLENQVDVELLDVRVAHSERNVFQIAKQSDPLFVIHRLFLLSVQFLVAKLWGFEARRRRVSWRPCLGRREESQGSRALGL